MVKLNCSNCNKEFEIPESHFKYKKLRNQNYFYCSKECYLKKHSNGKIVKCVNCGKKFRVKGYRKAKDFYCSRKCRKTSKIIKCWYCHKEFIRKLGVIKRNKQRHFCSRECMGKWQSENLKGENSPSWLGGWEKYYGINWVEQKNKARKRDNYTCQLCAKKENKKAFDVHHKIPFRKFGIKRYLEANSLDNLITLCNFCHSKYEPRRKNL